jgi:hypothetical protein
VYIPKQKRGKKEKKINKPVPKLSLTTVFTTTTNHTKLESRLMDSISNIFRKNTTYKNVAIAMTQPTTARSKVFT